MGVCIDLGGSDNHFSIRTTRGLSFPVYVGSRDGMFLGASRTCGIPEMAFCCRCFRSDRRYVCGISTLLWRRDSIPVRKCHSGDSLPASCESRRFYGVYFPALSLPRKRLGIFHTWCSALWRKAGL